MADADPVSGTLVFSTDRTTVITETRRRRDARSGPDNGGKAPKSVLDLPDVEESRRDPGELVN